MVRCNEMRGKPVEFGPPGLWADGSGTVTSANRGRSVLGSWYELPGSRFASAKVIGARLLRNTPRVPEGVMFSLVERPE